MAPGSASQPRGHQRRPLGAAKSDCCSVSFLGVDLEEEGCWTEAQCVRVGTGTAASALGAHVDAGGVGPARAGSGGGREVIWANE